MTYIKKFSDDFKEGEEDVIDQISEMKEDKDKDNKHIIILLTEMLRKFKKIDQSNYSKLRDDNELNLLFFQKYCVYRINLLRDR